MKKSLDFEKPIQELEEKIKKLRELSKNGQKNLNQEIEKIQERTDKLKLNIYENLTPGQIIQIARHPDRPDTLSLIRLIFDHFTQLHGDRLYADDPSLVGGLATINKHKVVVLGHQKGHDTKENIYRNFGMPNPEGYRKALRLMKLAEKFNIPVVSFIDTPGAYPGMEAEERGQAEAIARNLKEMSGLTIPLISFVIGEGGSGGALGIGLSNKLYMLEHSIYSVISPEGCASILYKDTSKAEDAAKNLKITAKDIKELGLIDDIVKEPAGGGHQDWEAVAKAIKAFIMKDLKHYAKEKKSEKIIEERYQKFRLMGRFE